jgi:hypothetical protein
MVEDGVGGLEGGHRAVQVGERPGHEQPGEDDALLGARVPHHGGLEQGEAMSGQGLVEVEPQPAPEPEPEVWRESEERPVPGRDDARCGRGRLAAQAESLASGVHHEIVREPPSRRGAFGAGRLRDLAHQAAQARVLASDAAQDLGHRRP